MPLFVPVQRKPIKSAQIQQRASSSRAPQRPSDLSNQRSTNRSSSPSTPSRFTSLCRSSSPVDSVTKFSLDLQESGWEELRREARKIEGDLDVKLSSYGKIGSRFTQQGGYADTGSPTVGSNRSWKSMEMEIQSLLEKLLDINDSMSRCAASALATTSVTQKLARHRDILHEFTQEFRRIKGNINSMREHAELLSSVRDDISEYKASGSTSPRMQLLRERATIHGNVAHMDEVINQAQATRSVLGSQRVLFGDVQGKVKLLSDKFPVIRGLLGAIRRKKSRDTLILTGVIAACTLFLIIYWLSK